jgi:hypothetical protein
LECGGVTPLSLVSLFWLFATPTNRKTKEGKRRYIAALQIIGLMTEHA